MTILFLLKVVELQATAHYCEGVKITLSGLGLYLGISPTLRYIRVQPTQKTS